MGILEAKARERGTVMIISHKEDEIVVPGNHHSRSQKRVAAMSFNLSRTQFLQMFAVMQSIKLINHHTAKAACACTFVEKRKHQ